jgi:hypothetical protein
MIWFILGLTIGIWAGWRYSYIIDDIIESLKTSK